MLILRDWRRLVWWPTIMFAFFFAVLFAARVDRSIARALFYDPATGWIGSGAGAWWAHDLIHGAGHWAVRGVAVAALGAWLLSFRVTSLVPWRREALYVFAGMTAVMLLVGSLKMVTNIDCPWNVDGFGGTQPYVTLFGDRPDYLPQARCFPGAHSASGFALLALYFVLRDRARRASLVALGVALAVGVIFAIGQEARGAHFLSHDLAGAFIAWSVLVALYSAMLKGRAGRQEIAAGAP